MVKWMVIAIVFICVSLLLAAQTVWKEGEPITQEELYGSDNVKTCAIGCYIEDYADSRIEGDPYDAPRCICTMPFYEDMQEELSIGGGE